MADGEPGPSFSQTEKWMWADCADGGLLPLLVFTVLDLACEVC